VSEAREIPAEKGRASQSITESSRERTSQGEKAILCDALPFSVGVGERLVRLLPDGPCALAGSWKGKPPPDTADAVLWRIAALLKFEPQTQHMAPEAHRPMIHRIAEHMGIDDDDGWRLFSRSFARVMVGIGSLNQLMQQAKEDAESDIAGDFDYQYVGLRPVSRQKSRRLLVAIHFRFLTGAKAGERWISTRDAGSLIGVDPSTAGSWIKSMVTDRYLEKIATGTEFRAPRYRWIYS
jgi:hypothetical protein